MDDLRRAIGRAGEDLAADYVTQTGLRIIERNWRDGRRGELDIIAVDNESNCYVVVEVRTRIGQCCGSAFASINAKKYARLRRLSAAWLAQQEVKRHVRLDFFALEVSPSIYDALHHGCPVEDCLPAFAFLRWEKAVAG